MGYGVILVLKKRVSEHYGLGRSQSELDFVDVYINDDMPLYIDPYVFKVRPDIWSVQCNNLIVDFFETVIGAIVNKDQHYARHLLELLSEPKETHLGISTHGYAGKGVSGKQANDLYKKLRVSRAAKSGFLKDLSDCELMIPGIGFDKVSDITTNIIREQLIKYTQDQCHLHNIPMFSVPSGKIWSPTDKRWRSGYYTELPLVDNKPLLLIPKFAVVYKPNLSSKELYDHEILDYIQATELKAMSPLVEVLKNGKRRVTKKSLKELPQYRMTKEFIYTFCNKHPDVMEAYKARKRKKAIRVQDIDSDSEMFVAQELIDELTRIPTGTADATRYHNAMLAILEFLFFPHLVYPQKETEIHDGRKRIDITFHNAATSGFWYDMKVSPQCSSAMMMFECKNYSSDIKNTELDQMAGRFANIRGWFGVILCRHFEDKDLFLKRCQDTARDGRGVIICLDDGDVVKMLECAKTGNRSDIDKILIQKYQEIIS